MTETAGGGQGEGMGGGVPGLLAGPLRLDAARAMLGDDSGRVFDPRTRRWRAGPGPSSGAAAAWTYQVDLPQAAHWLQRESGAALRVPIGVVGPRDPAPSQYAAAEAIARGIARMGFAIVCGGRSGVMEAACKGAAAAGGLAIAVLPDADPGSANPWASVVLATGIGEARNVVIARASLCLVAVGDSFGTLSEVALGRQFGKLVVALEGAAQIDGVVAAATVDQALQWIAACALGLLEGGPARA